MSNVISIDFKNNDGELDLRTGKIPLWLKNHADSVISEREALRREFEQKLADYFIAGIDSQDDRG